MTSIGDDPITTTSPSVYLFDKILQIWVPPLQSNAINQSRRNLKQNIKFLEDKENLHNLGIAFGISGFVLDTGIVLGIWN